MRLEAHHVRALKGVRQLVQVNVDGPEQAAAAEAAGIDIVVTGRLDQRAAVRAAAPLTHVCFSLPYGAHADEAALLRAAFENLAMGADSVYCALSPRFIEPLAREGIPVCAHAGLVPQKARLTGTRAFGKTAAEARRLLDATRAFEAAGAFALELECVAAPVAALLCRSTAMTVVSIGSGAGCDVQYLFGLDILGQGPGRRPRHARAWDDFAAELDRLQARRVAAFRAFRDAVADGTFPGPAEIVAGDPAETDAFRARLAAEAPPS